jgi:DNA-binding NarL/FixJ family response regulator
MTDILTMNIGTRNIGRNVQRPEQGVGSLRIGLVDCHKFSRECLIKALERHEPEIDVFPFLSFHDFTGDDSSLLDLIMYYPHGDDACEETMGRDLRTIRGTLPDTPIVVLSDVAEAHQPKTIRSTLNSGAHGFIPTRTTGIPIAIAAIRFVKAGGTFAPIDQLFNAHPSDGPALPYSTSEVPLTARQIAVLSHLRQGKANKIIAFELSMSESTVKVHIRNIMRKMGATNRTQAAYKAQELWKSIELQPAPNL